MPDKAGLRIHGTTCAQPAVVFVQHEAGTVASPRGVYRVPVYVEVKVHRDYHVQIDSAFIRFRNTFSGNAFRLARTTSW